MKEMVLRMGGAHLGLRSKLFAEMKSLGGLAIPVITAQLAQMAMNFTDVMMAGQLSARDLAAIAVGSSYGMPVYLLAMGTLMAVNPIVAHLHGAGRHDEIGGKLHQAVWLGLILVVPCMLLMHYSGWLLSLLQIEASVQILAADYLRAHSWGWPFIFTFVAMRFFNEGLGQVKGYTVILIASVPFNAALNWMLMYGTLGFPAMGAVGTGYASAVVMVIMCVAMAVWTWHKQGKMYQLSQFSRPNPGELRELLAVGFPNGVTMTMQVGMFALMTLLIGSLGVNQVSAHQIAINIASIIYMVPLGISIAVSIRVGQAMGRDDREAVRLTVLAGLSLGAGLALVMALGLWLTAPLLVAIYTNDEAVARLAVSLLLYAAVFQVSDGLQTIGVGSLRGLKDTRYPMLMSMISFWLVGMPVGYLFGMVLGYGVAGFWIGILASLTLAAVLFNLRFYLKTRP